MVTIIDRFHCTYCCSVVYIQVWNSNTGVPQVKFEGIIESREEDSILCINLSADNSRLIGSSTSGLVMVR